MVTEVSSRWARPDDPLPEGWEDDQREYFGAILDDFNKHGGQSNFLHYLLNVDLTGFNVRSVPESVGLQNQKDEGTRHRAKWAPPYIEFFRTGHLPDGSFVDDGGLLHVPTKELREALGGGFHVIGTQMRKAGAGTFRDTAGERKSYYTFSGTLDHHRDIWLEANPALKKETMLEAELDWPGVDGCPF